MMFISKDSGSPGIVSGIVVVFRIWIDCEQKQHIKGVEYDKEDIYGSHGSEEPLWPSLVDECGYDRVGHNPLCHLIAWKVKNIFQK